jgi:hypothetical protein
MRGMVQDLRQKQFGRFDGLLGATVAKFGVREQIWCEWDRFVGGGGHGKRAGRFNHEKVASANSWLRNERFLSIPVVERVEWSVDFRVLRSKEVRTEFSRIGASQGPCLFAVRKGRA